MAVMILKQTQANTMKAQLSDLLISISWADWLNAILDGLALGFIISWMASMATKSLQPLQTRNANSCAVLSLT